MGRRGHKRPNGDGSIWQRADGRWEAVLVLGVRADGKLRRKSFYGKSYESARKKLDEARRALQEGLPVVVERQTLRQFLERWLRDVVQVKVAPATHQTYESLVRIHIVPLLGRLPLEKLTAQHVQQLLLEKQTSECGISPKTVKHIRDVLRNALEVALRWGLVARNVAALAETPRQRRPAVTVYTASQARTFLAAIEGHRFHSLVLLTLVLALRKGEVLGLRWQDVDFEGGTLRVQRSVHRVAIFDSDGKRPTEGRRTVLQIAETKTEGSNRPIRLPAVVLAALARHRERQQSERAEAGDSWIETGLVFTSRKGTPMEPRNLTRDFEHFSALAELPRIRFHDLRHSAVVILRQAGVPMKVIQKLLGHSSIRTTQEFYDHLLADDETRAASTMDEIFMSEGNPVTVGVTVSGREKLPS